MVFRQKRLQKYIRISVRESALCRLLYLFSKTIKEIEKINNKRYTALFNRLQQACEGEILKYQLANDYEKLMQLNEKLSDTTRLLFDQVKLKLTGEQRAAYTTIGGSPHLDGEYTVFGEVIEGMEIVDSIAEQETDDNCRPLRDVVILKIEEE
mgnify:CR=1 FL=1